MSVLFPLPKGRRLLRVQQHDENAPKSFVLETISRSARCPLCQRASKRVHSRYWRTLADLPCSGVPISLRVHARKFFCDNPDCIRHIFTQRSAPLITANAQKTDRLKLAQTSIGQAVGSRPGVRLATRLTMPTSATTLLRLEIVSRDRAQAYASGIRQGAPEAQQVTDRFHLIKNLGQTLERVLEGERALLCQAAQHGREPEPLLCQTAQPADSEVVAPDIGRGQPESIACQQQGRREERVQRYEQVRDLFAKGGSIGAIARHLSLSPKTVRRFAASATFPERQERSPRACRIDAFKKHLQKRWEEGCHNGAVLHDEIRERGYGGAARGVGTYLSTLRRQPTAGQDAARVKVSPRQIAMWALLRETERTARQKSILDRLQQVCVPFQCANALAQRFLWMVRQTPRTDQTQRFRQWLSETLHSGVAALRGYGASLEQDQAAVEAGLSLPWSNGPVEGSNNRLKFVKRRGYGRAHFDLLRRRVLQPV